MTSHPKDSIGKQRIPTWSVDICKLTWAAVFRSVYGTTPVMSSLPTHSVMSKAAPRKKPTVEITMKARNSEQAVYKQQ